MRNSFIVIAGLFVAGIISIAVSTGCKGNQKISSADYVGKEYQTESGLKYTIHKAGTGRRAELGDIVQVHYAGRLRDSTEFDNSFKRGTPISFELGVGRVIKGWDEGIAILNVGDSATFDIPYSLAYGSKAQGPIPANSDLIFDVVLVSATSPALPFDAKGKDTLKIAEGLQILKILEKPDGTAVVNGNTVTVHYSGFLKNGKKFDSSVDRGQPFSFTVGQGEVIKGWDLGVAQLKKGEKAKFIISSELAYGDRGVGNIPPNATLIFDVEILEVN